MANALPSSPVGGFVELDGETFYRISAFHRLAPFFMSLPSDTDLWMFVASGGGLTAGRVDAKGSLFPYQTVDQLHDAHRHSGPLTLLRVERENAEQIRWKPFAESESDNGHVERNLYKNAIGNQLVFEEIRHDLGLALRYRWAACDEFGWVRSATLENRGRGTVTVTVLDGLRNILPYGAPLSLYQQSSSLVDAYKKSELDPETGLGIYSLTSRITDRAEALEVLRANVVWGCGLEDRRVSLSGEAVADFDSGKLRAADTVLNGARGNYFVSSGFELGAGDSSHWHMISDTGLDHAQIARLRHRILEEKNLANRIEASIREASENLWRIVGSADGVQLTGRAESWSHHFANVLFNNMRGGVFLRNHSVPVEDLVDFLRVRNGEVATRQRKLLAGLPASVTVQELHDVAQESHDANFRRLCYEYLPLYFGRRHGDPSRPWNRFSIRTRNEVGERELSYEGNWRDIFQNWEALGASFPGFLPSMVAKFVNASTVDGFNPYRVTRDGVDWEIVEEDDPWSNIGYWGDHQIVYLLRLLEMTERYQPAALGDLLAAEIFSYAEVPYRIKPYEDILQDPSSTIDFDLELEERIEERVKRQGTDGKLLLGPDGSVYHVNLLEKLLVPALSKLSNLIPDAGIWMNTQRPEWNDANNALAAGGVSVVTLCYLRRYLLFLRDRLTTVAGVDFRVSQEVADWFDRIESTFEIAQGLLSGECFDSKDRKRLMDALGGAFSAYRNGIYHRGFSGKTEIGVQRVVDLCEVALKFIDRSIATNRRSDGLYHTYNLLEFADDGSSVEVVALQEMLEGQVAVLSSGTLDPPQALDVLQALYDSALYRPSQRSFMLYPERELPGFLQKNVVDASRVDGIGLLKDLVAAGDRSLLVLDDDGIYRFHGDLRNADDLAETLDSLGEQKRWAATAERDRTAILDLFEDVFQHRSYTGRSGVMYGYEGLGCIYWHMIAKLLVAVQENVFRAQHEDLPKSTRDGLTRMYFRVRSGIGYEKSVTEYGAFPTDPYSHTPPQGGAKQPGMTGQVKEEILTRIGELGVHVENGTVRFAPALLNPYEFLEQPASYSYVDVDGKTRPIRLSAGTLAFTFCQVPVIYERVEGRPRIHVEFSDGSSKESQGNVLDAKLSAKLFARGGKIDRIQVGVSERDLNPGPS